MKVIKKPLSILVGKTIGEVWEDIKKVKMLGNQWALVDHANKSVWWEDRLDEDESGLRDTVKVRDCIGPWRFPSADNDSLLFISVDEWKEIAKEYEIRTSRN